jgi:KUP system potassium uptake protein
MLRLDNRGEGGSMALLALTLSIRRHPVLYGLGLLGTELVLFAANIVKIERGGWLPLTLAGAVFFVVTTWRRGTALVTQRLAELSIPLARFLDDVESKRPPRVRGTAVFLTPRVDNTPASLVPTSVTTTCCTRKSFCWRSSPRRCLRAQGRAGRTSFVLGRARLLPSGPAPMMRWRKRIFAFMAWSASSAMDFFGLPPDCVIALSARLEF